MGGDWGGEGEGERVALEHALSNFGRDWVGTTGVGGAKSSSMAASPTESSACGSGLKISQGEIVWRPLSDSGKANKNGLSGEAGRWNGEPIESGDEDVVHGESGGVVTVSETLVRGEGWN